MLLSQSDFGAKLNEHSLVCLSVICCTAVSTAACFNANKLTMRSVIVLKTCANCITEGGYATQQSTLQLSVVALLAVTQVRYATIQICLENLENLLQGDANQSKLSH
jgi:hypothetical protein